MVDSTFQTSLAIASFSGRWVLPEGNWEWLLATVLFQLFSQHVGGERLHEVIGNTRLDSFENTVGIKSAKFARQRQIPGEATTKPRSLDFDVKPCG